CDGRTDLLVTSADFRVRCCGRLLHRHIGAMDVGAVEAPTIEERAMQTITTIGLDIAKSVFQVHGVDAGGQVVIRRQLKHRYVLTFFQKLSPCLVVLKPAPRRTTGHANCRDWVTSCG